MKKVFTFGLILFAMFALLVSCSNNAVEAFGVLEINIDSDVSRGLEPISMETRSYNVTVMDSTGATVFTSSSSAKTSYTTSVPIGNCTVNVEALNKTGDVIGSGYASCDIRAGQENTITVRVTEPAGNGTFSMSVKGKAGNNLSYVIKDASLATVKQGSLAYSNGKYSATETLQNGFYYFSIMWNDADEPVRTETIRVVKGKTISYEAEFLFLIDGTLSITNEIIGTPAIVLNRSSRALTAGKTLTVSAEISGIQNYTCFWSVDDVPLSGLQAYADLELPMAGLAEGEHTVALVVSDGTVIWSESASFAVLPDRPTELEVSGDVELWVIGDVLIPYQLKTTVYLGNRYTRNFTTMGHRYESLGNDSVILSCSLDRDDYTYYLDTEYDSTNNRTVVYVVIDQYIEDPAYLEVSLTNTTSSIVSSQYGGGFGVYLNASNHEFSQNMNTSSYWRRQGLVAFTKDNDVRTVKVPADTYTFDGNDWSNVNDYFYVNSDKTSVTVAGGQTKQISFTEGDYGYITIQLPDAYADGTEFYGISGTTSNSKLSLIINPNWTYSYTFYPRYAKDCYYTVSINESAGNHTVYAEKHDCEFFDSGITVPAGRVNISFDVDSLIPSDLVIQCRVGENYSSFNSQVWRMNSSLSLNASSAGSLEIWVAGAEDYDITTSVDNSGNVIIHVTIASDNYAILNLTYDFDLSLGNNGTAISFGLDGNGYILPIVDKNRTEIKAMPGNYSNWSWWNTISDGNGNNYYPTASPNSFTVAAGGTKDLTIQMSLRTYN